MKQIPGYPGYYATSQGEIISKRSNPHKVLATREHKGYLHVNIKNGIGRNTQRKEPVHKLVLLAFYGQRPEGMECRHLNGNPLDNRVDNLVWGTPKENMQDQIRHGTASCLRRGEDAVRAKLKLQQVITIKKLVDIGLNNTEIAEQVGIARYLVQNIRSGNSWNHVTPRGRVEIS